MNRSDRRANKRNPQEYIKFLEKQIADLLSERGGLIQQYNSTVGMLNLAQATGKITFIGSDEVEQGQMIIPDATVVAMEAKAVNDAHRDFLITLADLRELTARIDSMAAYATDINLRKDMPGLDEELSALFTRLVGKAKAMNLTLDSWLPVYSNLISRRIDAIQAVKKDGGKAIRLCVMETSAQLKEAAQEAVTKSRQGRIVEPETRYIIEKAKEFKYAQNKSWTEAARAMWQELDQQRRTLTDSVKKNVLATFDEQKKTDYVTLGIYVKNTWHNNPELH